MSVWFRLYTDVVNNPKVQLLPAEVFRAWINILCICKESGGKVPSLAKLSFQMRCSESQASSWVAQLVEADLMDVIGNDTIPHQWNEYQYISDVSTERVKRYRKRKGNVSVTPPEQSRTDTEQNRANTEGVREIPASEILPLIRRQPAALTARAESSMRFPEFWQRYPLRDVSENTVAGVWIGLVTVSNEDAAFACLDRYLASDQVARGVVKSANNWLHDCARANWACEWPAAAKNGTGVPKADKNAEALAMMDRIQKQRQQLK